MIIIGEKINGSIPSVAEAIANRDAEFIKQRALAQANSGASYIDCCASVPETVPAQMFLQKLTNSAGNRVYLTLYPVKEIRSIRFFLLWHSLKIKGGRLSHF